MDWGRSSTEKKKKSNLTIIAMNGICEGGNKVELRSCWGLEGRDGEKSPKRKGEWQRFFLWKVAIGEIYIYRVETKTN
jgi:hypothetical protein